MTDEQDFSCSLLFFMADETQAETESFHPVVVGEAMQLVDGKPSTALPYTLICSCL